MRLATLICAFGLPVVLAGCFSGKPSPVWKQEAVSRSELYQKLYVEDAIPAAEASFAEAVATAERTGNIDTLGRLYVFRNAIHLACWDAPDWAAYDAVAPYLEDSATLAAGSWMRGRTPSGELARQSKLWGKPHAWLAASPTEATWRKRIEAEEDTLRKLLYTRLYTEQFGADTTLLTQAMEAASRAGWVRAFQNIAREVVHLLESEGRIAEAERVRYRLTLSEGGTDA